MVNMKLKRFKMIAWHEMCYHVGVLAWRCESRRWVRWMVNTNEPDWRTVLMSQIASRGIYDKSGTRWEGAQRVMRNGRSQLAVIKVFLVVMQDWICVREYLSVSEMNHLWYNSNASIHVQNLFSWFITSDWGHFGWCTNIYKIFEWLNRIILIFQQYLLHLKNQTIVRCSWKYQK